MTRVEVFSDAAFAFAVTMLVVSFSSIPQNYAELVLAIKGVPAFAAGFTLIAIFWSAHRNWSQRFGLEEGLSNLLSLGLIFVVLVYVYPLKLITSSGFAWITNGYLPTVFHVDSPEEITGLFVIYGIGVFLLAGILTGLYQRANSLADELNLNQLERLDVKLESTIWGMHALVGILSATVAAALPIRLAIHAGFIYMLLPILSPLIAIRFKKLKSATAES